MKRLRGRHLSQTLLALTAGNSLLCWSVEAATTTADPVTYTHARVYDAYGRLITGADANNNPTDYAYDAVGNLIQMTDALGYKTQMTYDALNRLES